MVEMLLNIIIATLENHMDNETNYFHGYIHINIYNNFFIFVSRETDALNILIK